jgi:hypothetical protein
MGVTESREASLLTPSLPSFGRIYLDSLIVSYSLLSLSYCETISFLKEAEVYQKLNILTQNMNFSVKSSGLREKAALLVVRLALNKRRTHTPAPSNPKLYALK